MAMTAEQGAKCRLERVFPTSAKSQTVCVWPLVSCSVLELWAFVPQRQYLEMHRQASGRHSQAVPALNPLCRALVQLVPAHSSNSKAPGASGHRLKSAQATCWDCALA